MYKGISHNSKIIYVRELNFDVVNYLHKSNKFHFDTLRTTGIVMCPKLSLNLLFRNLGYDILV